jgi:hypothetical protein
MNSLNRELKKGDRLVLDDGQECLIETEGFGCRPAARGTAIYVKNDAGREGRIEGSDIDAKATMERFAAINGWTS